MEEPNNLQPKSAEGPLLPLESPHRTISGFWRRLLALIIDGLLLGLVGFVCGLVLFDPLAQLGGWGRVIGFLIALAYFGILNSSIGKGQTVGKRLMTIEVVDRFGQHILLARSLVRSVVLATPFFLNGALIPPGVMMSPVGYVIGFILFGLGGAIIYLYAFNRLTRQSLHDLAVGTFVTNTSPQGEVRGSVWRPHITVVGIWVVAVIGLSVVMTGLSRKGVVPGLLDVQRAIQASGKVHVATVNVGKSWRYDNGLRSETTYFYSNAIWKRRPQDEESAARVVASIILSNYPAIDEQDVLTVSIAYGFDIGIAHAWRSHTSTHSPKEWQQLVAGESKD